MIIDDSTVFRKVVSMHLKNANFEVVEAVDGLDALNKLEAEKVNLIICDVNMPNMDGLTFVGKVRANPSLKFIPVIMLTTESQEEKKLKGMEAGARAWLVKPFSPEQLLSAISRLMR
ncbi:MAG: response regulator [Leptospiraceae bacterium]|nr:response regulator [Leptospiraceae bacterium]MCP5501579.1 response regulator [Leptospiraceae bacterium]